MTEGQWTELLGYYNECARAADPHCGAARRFGLVPKSIAVTLALKCSDRIIANQVPQALVREARSDVEPVQEPLEDLSLRL